MFRSALTIIREYVQLHGEVTEKIGSVSLEHLRRFVY